MLVDRNSIIAPKLLCHLQLNESIIGVFRINILCWYTICEMRTWFKPKTSKQLFWSLNVLKLQTNSPVTYFVAWVTIIAWNWLRVTTSNLTISIFVSWARLYELLHRLFSYSFWSSNVYFVSHLGLFLVWLIWIYLLA